MALNSTEIEDFLFFSENLNLIVSVNNSDIVLVALNNIPMPKDFISEVNAKCNKAISFFSDALYNKNISPEYYRILSKRLRYRLSCCYYENEILTYDKLQIVDKQGNKFDYDDLTDSVKHELSELIAVLKNELLRFEDIISEYETEKPCTLKYIGAKIDLVAEAAIYYESDLFDIDKTIVSRNDFINLFVKALGGTVDSPSKTFDKIKNKSNPVQYLIEKMEIGKELFSTK